MASVPKLPTYEPFRLDAFAIPLLVQPGFLIPDDVTAEIYDEDDLLIPSEDIEVDVDKVETEDTFFHILNIPLSQGQVESLPELSQIYISWSGSRKLMANLAPSMGGGSVNFEPVKVSIVEVRASGDTASSIAASSQAVAAKNVAVSAKDIAVAKAAEAETNAVTAEASKDTAVEKATESVAGAAIATTKAGEALTSATAAAAERATVQTLSADVTTKATQVATDATQVATNATLAVTSKNAAQVSEQVASTSAMTAQNAAAAAMLNTPAFKTIAAGMAATSVGGLFQVVGTGEVAGTVYEKTGAGASDYALSTEYPSPSLIAATAAINYSGVTINGQTREGGTNAPFASTITLADDAYGKKSTVSLGSSSLSHPTFLIPATGAVSLAANKIITLFYKPNTISGSSTAGVSVIIGGADPGTQSYTLIAFGKDGVIVRLVSQNGAAGVATTLLAANGANAWTTTNIISYLITYVSNTLRIRAYRDSTLILDHVEPSVPTNKNVYAGLRGSIDASFRFSVKTEKFSEFSSTDLRITSVETEAAKIPALSSDVSLTKDIILTDQTLDYEGEVLVKLTRNITNNAEVLTTVLGQTDVVIGGVKMKAVTTTDPVTNNTFISEFFGTEEIVFDEYDTVSLYGRVNSVPNANTGLVICFASGRTLADRLIYYVYTSSGAIAKADINNAAAVTTSIRIANPTYAFIAGSQLEIRVTDKNDGTYDLGFYLNGVLNQTVNEATIPAGAEVTFGLRGNSNMNVYMHARLNRFERLWREVFIEGGTTPNQEDGVSMLEWKINNADFVPTIPGFGPDFIANFVTAPNVNPDNGQTAGNTGLGYDTRFRQFVSSDYNLALTSGLSRWRRKDLVPYSASGTIIPIPTSRKIITNYIDHIQGCDYDKELDADWAIGTKKGAALLDTNRVLICVDRFGGLIDYYEFTALSFEPGMLAVYGDSLYIKPNNKGWFVEINKNTKAIIRQPNTFSSREGFGIDKSTGDLWISDDVGDIRRFTNGLVQLSTHTLTTFGTQAEGFAIDPADGTLWVNADANLHGGIPNGNTLWHFDFAKTYKKFVRFPEMIPYSAGTVSGGLKINADGKLVNIGQWDGPVLDVGASVDYLTNTPVITQEGKVVTVQFRSSTSAPTTTVDTEMPISFYQGWGATVPGSWQSTPQTGRYQQMRLTITNQ